MSKKSKVKNSNETSQKKVDYEKIRKRNEKLRKELVHHVKIHKESVKVSGSARIQLYFSRKFNSKIVKIKFQLVEEVSEGKFSAAEVQKILKNVDQMFYQDIVEERSGNDCCGYLLCDKECIYMYTRFALIGVF